MCTEKFSCGQVFSGQTYFVVLIFVCCVITLDSKQFQKNLPAKMVWAVPGSNADLPCDITPALPGDNVTMIFWFKDNSGMPLYSLDARHGPVDQASHLTTSDDLGARSYFITEEEPSKARLRVQRVNTQDQGIYRCRVDFVNSPTRNFQVNLTLVVHPSAPKIFDAEGREIRINSPAGPFLEDQELFLSCQVHGGKPKPTLTWWHNGTILDGVIDSSRASSTTVNQLIINNIPRRMKGSRLECRASSSEEAGYISREVPLTVFLKPSKVKIVSPNDLLSISKSQSIRCETSGSYPPAKLTWLLDGKAIRSALITEEETETFTGSILSLNVAPEDDGKDLVCRADNPRFPGGSAEDRRQIHVAYPPKVSVKLDSEDGPEIKEGMDVTFQCVCAARPEPQSFSWYLDSHLIPYNESAGILPMDETLILRNVKRNSAGQYACSAINSEGETYSAPFDLKVQYAPRCKKGFEIKRIGALHYETIVAQCQVDSFPEVTKFSWTYNTSEGVSPVQAAKMENEGGISMLHFTPKEENIESISCWATNSVGRQLEPCTFYITPAEVPESPKSCLVRNTTHGTGLEVSCIAGKDGGLHQSFVLEVLDITQPHLPPGATTLSDQGDPLTPKYRVLGERPVFTLHSLELNKDYQVLVYAENAKGKSNPPVVLPNIRIKSINGEMDRSDINKEFTKSEKPVTSGLNMTVIIVAAAVIVLILIFSIITVTSVLACRKPTLVVRRRDRRSSKPPDEFDLSEAGFGEGFHRRSDLYRASMYGECEDRIQRILEGPDLILAPVSLSQQNLDF